MKPEIVTIDNDETDPPPLQEVEFALILAQMINTVKQDPTQLRFAVYEFARSKLAHNLPGTDEAERKRLQSALEVAIKGVEQFSQRGDQEQRLLPAPPPSTALTVGPDVPARSSQVTVISPDRRDYTEAEWKPLPSRFGERRRTFRRWRATSIAAGVLIAAGLAGLLYLPRTMQTPPAPVVSAPPPETKVAAPPETLPFPIPSDYGIYVLNNGKLSELDPLPIMVPDKRVALSTPVSKESRTTLPDGHARFVAFRRDLVANAPDRVDVRVVARVVRALTFDANGKASYSPVSDEWSIRNTAFEFRVRPIAGHPEMLLIQPENPDFTLPPGRYILALKSQAYDFTIAGEVTDPSQCLERTDAANGTFYSDCPKK